MVDRWRAEPDEISPEEAENLDPDELRKLGWRRLADRLEEAQG